MSGPEVATVVSVSKAMVALHKEQFGRGPRLARTTFAGPDVLVTVLDDALLPAERAMVAMGACLRVEESRLFLQERATRGRFIETVEQIVVRKVRSFQSACDPAQRDRDGDLDLRAAGRRRRELTAQASDSRRCDRSSARAFSRLLSRAS